MALGSILQNGKQIDVEVLSENNQNFKRLARNIGKQLGEQRHLLDTLIYGILKTLNRCSVDDINPTDQEDVIFELRRLCRVIRDGKSSEHPFFFKLKTYIDAHPCPDEAVYIDYYSAAVFLDYIRFAIDQYNKKLEQFQVKCLEEADVECIYKKLSEFVSTSELDRMISYLINTLIITPYSNILLQVLSEQYIYSLITPNEKTSRCVFQYLLDKNIDNE